MVVHASTRERFEITPLVRRKRGFRTKHSRVLYIFDRVSKKYVAGPFDNRRDATIARESIRLQVKEMAMAEQKQQQRDQQKDNRPAGQGSTDREKQGTDQSSTEGDRGGGQESGDSTTGANDSEQSDSRK